MREAVRKLWPELEWISLEELREAVASSWVRALELSPLAPADLQAIPFPLLVPDCPITFMEHKRAVVHTARRSAEAMRFSKEPGCGCRRTVVSINVHVD